MVLDFGKFASDALKSVDRIRSLGGDPKSIEGNPTKPTESRINSFYRAVGLPALVSDASKFPGNNGNINSTELSEDVKAKFAQREVAFNQDVPASIVETFLDGQKGTVSSEDNINNLTIADGIKFISSGDQTSIPKRTRGSLFPMLVNGDIGVFPKENRIAKPFISTRDVIEDDIKYERPLLELIILIRLRSEGAGDAEIQKALNEEFQKSLGENFFSDADINIFTFNIVTELSKSILALQTTVKTTIRELGKIRAYVRTIYEDQKENIPDEKAIPSLVKENTGQLEKIKQQQQKEMALKDSLLSLLEYDDTMSNGAEVTRNMKDAWLAHSLLEVLTTRSQDIDISLKETDTRLKKLEQLNQAQQRQMDLLLGTFSGLSGIDVLVIILALFTVDRQVVLGLLNDDNFERLRTIKGKSPIGERLDVLSAVDELQKKVTQIYDQLQQLIDTDKPLESSQLSRGATK